MGGGKPKGAGKSKGITVLDAQATCSSSGIRNIVSNPHPPYGVPSSAAVPELHRNDESQPAQPLGKTEYAQQVRTSTLQYVDHPEKVRRRRTHTTCLRATKAATLLQQKIVAGSDCLPGDTRYNVL